MQRFYPFLLAALGTVLALGLTFVVVRTYTVAKPPRSLGWRRRIGRAVDEVAEAIEDVAERIEGEASA